MTNNNNEFNSQFSNIKVSGQVLLHHVQLRIPGAILSDEGSKQKVSARMAQIPAALTQLKPIWKGINIILGSKVRSLRSLAIYILLYAANHGP